MNDDEYRSQLLTQLANAKSPAIAEYLNWLYAQIASELSQEEKILEIGAGAGISKLFLGNLDIHRTDLLSHDQNEVQPNVNAETLPFLDGEFQSAFAVDMIHHVPFPYKVVSELIRTTSPRGKIIFVEPYVSFFSYFIYKIFHREKTSIRLKFSPEVAVVGNMASDGDQSVCQKIFFSKTGQEYLSRFLPEETVTSRQLISPFSFFLTGGVNNPFKISPKLIRLVLKLEKRIPQRLLKLIASRQSVVFSK